MNLHVFNLQHIGKRLPPQYKEAKNANGETPMMIFRREHKDLKKDGEEWMKTEAISNMIIALIAIAFVAALSVFLMGNTTYVTSVSENTRLLFTILRSIMFLTSTSSMMFFQSILISSFLEEDFHYKLPLKLMGGLVMLFLSLTSLLVAFGATISYLMLAGILPKIVIFASVPVFLLVLLKLKSLGETIHSWI